MHASDEAASGYTCHYDTHEVGPASRYLAAGGLGLTGEGLSLAYGPTAAAAFAANEAAVLAEGGNVPPGAHFANLIDPSHAWAGVAAEPSVIAPGFFQVDVELVTPGGHSTVIAPAGYPVTSGCPAGTSANAS
jgi:hypothetical protein